MMRSLYSGISGLRNHQTRMDVIGNNIANVNTTGYKASRVVFQDIFSQTVSGGTANSGAVGGTNPRQIGLGIMLSSIDVLHTRSAFARTDNATDMMIDGDGFFIVQAPPARPGEDGGYLYTRAGNFSIDNDGYLVSSHGYFVMAFPPDNYEDLETDYGIHFDGPYDGGLYRIRLAMENEDYDGVDDPFDDDYVGPEYLPLTGIAIGGDGSVSVMIGTRKITIAQMAVAMFSNPSGLEKAGNSLYRETDPSGAVLISRPEENGAGKVVSGGLEMSNVDLATEFTDMIVTQRGFQANSRIITVSDTMLEELVNLKR